MTDHSEARQAAHNKFDQMGEVLDKLRPGTGPGVTLMLKTAFDEGMEAGRSLEQERWISVEERQPDDDREILLYVADWRKREHHECVVLGNYLPNQQIFRPSGSHGWEKSVTAWMEKPAPPVHKGDS